MGVVQLLVTLFQYSFLFLFLLSPEQWEINQCTEVWKTIENGQLCWSYVEDFRPTQLSVGMWSVSMNAKKAELQYDGGILQFQRWKKEKIVPINISPEGKFYLFNQHHTSKAVLESSVISPEHKWLYTRVINNWSKVQTLPSFLNKMIKGNFIWLSDEKSHYPIDPQIIPKSLSDLVNDPFRSLALVTRNYRCWNSDDDDEQTLFPFVEFYWANFFRTNLNKTFIDYLEKKGIQYNQTVCSYTPYIPKCMGTEEDFMTGVLEEALRLCVSPAASKLPGYVGKLDLDFIFKVNGRVWDIYSGDHRNIANNNNNNNDNNNNDNNNKGNLYRRPA